MTSFLAKRRVRHFSQARTQGHQLSSQLSFARRRLALYGLGLAERRN
jgi:hypothetical protein